MGHAKGFISNSAGKTKSVPLNDGGLGESGRPFEKLFAKLQS
jgi:hypothetical protein